MKSPNNMYEVVTGEFEEIRMGSPQFAAIEIRGADFPTRGKSFGKAMLFSPDSRFLAIEQLVSAHEAPHTRAVVFDFERRKEIIVHDQNPGFIRRFIWSPECVLTITSWSLLQGERDYIWRPQPIEAGTELGWSPS